MNPYLDALVNRGDYMRTDQVGDPNEYAQKRQRRAELQTQQVLEKQKWPFTRWILRRFKVNEGEK